MCSGLAWDDAAAARFIAIAEGAERYAAWDIVGEERIWASAAELGDDCLEPARYPRCSDQELADPGCRVTRFDPDARIRWVRGTDLASGEDVWVPAAMACYHLSGTVPAERFVYRISTGYAVHTDPVEALVRGICEVAERDANAVLWLQRLSLPALDENLWSHRTRELIQWCAMRFLDVHLLDATTDIGVPTAYCVIAADHDRDVRRVVGAGAGRNLTAAAEKAIYEAHGVYQHVHSFGDEPPEEVASFKNIVDGARYMARPDRAAAFDFLLTGRRKPEGQALPSLPDAPAEALDRLVTTLTSAGMRPIAVNRTTQELHDVGLAAINIIIADMQPMSLDPLAQFKGHPRLYDAPRRMGYRVLEEKELNPWPQPFA
ncbi:YcaO-like family protein [Nonomuraea sp. K274]|uniref:YcaO-like family protein n=1 Tax=Nonomuraea cypriaca TaxID=1187855 RepID=A0A931AEX6_9ACTN|nr:YcaO-like family protein [Nonomuraea cypriaca]